MTWQHNKMPLHINLFRTLNKLREQIVMIPSLSMNFAFIIDVCILVYCVTNVVLLTALLCKAAEDDSWLYLLQKTHLLHMIYLYYCHSTISERNL